MRVRTSALASTSSTRSRRTGFARSNGRSGGYSALSGGTGRGGAGIVIDMRLGFGGAYAPNRFER
eukprot:659651-Pleurochrysis_carterae.AAC.1